MTLLQQKGVTNQHILLPGSTLVDDSLVSELKALNNRVTPLSLYTHGVNVQEESLDLDFIDEIYFSSPSCVRNFGQLFHSIPPKIVVTTAHQGVEAEYRKLFVH